jgi:hypothetical protein
MVAIENDIRNDQRQPPTNKHSTAQHSTAHHSTAQHSTEHYNVLHIIDKLLEPKLTFIGDW